MAWFPRKKTVPLVEVAKDLASSAVHGTSEESLREFFREWIEKPELFTDAARREWLALNLFAVVAAVGQAIDSKDTSGRLLDAMHDQVYASEFQTTAARQEFEKLLQQRYAEYSEVLREPVGEKAIGLGRIFAEAAFDTTDAAVLFASAKRFFEKIDLARDFLREVAGRFVIR